MGMKMTPAKAILAVLLLRVHRRTLPQHQLLKAETRQSQQATEREATEKRTAE